MQHQIIPRHQIQGDGPGFQFLKMAETLLGMVTGTGENWKVPIKTLITMLMMHSLSMIMISDHD